MRSMILPDRAALGTMHGKAAAIAPPLARLGIALVVPDGLDTDRFGTFTNETPRLGTMDDAARAKACAAIAATGLSVGIAYPSGDGAVSGFFGVPVPGHKFVDAIDLMLGEALENQCEPCLGIDVV